MTALGLSHHDSLMACFDRKGRRISLLSWRILRQFPSYRIVGYDEPVPRISVLTVWLGLNAGYTIGTVHLFETRVHGHDETHACYRYTTEEAALAGHLRVYRALGGK